MPSARLLLLIPLVFGVGCKKDPILPPPTGTENPEICGDGIDNDADGLLDCEDDDCSGNCVETACDDGTDNDGDGLADCFDVDCWGNGCAVARSRITSAGEVHWKQAGLDFAPTDGCSPYHLDTATITLNSPAGQMRYLSPYAGPDGWTTCSWAAAKSVVKDANFTGSSFAAPRLLLRSGFTVDAACPLQDQRVFLPLIVTLDRGAGMWALRTGAAGGGPPWFGMTGAPTPYDSTFVNGPVHTQSSCNFNVTGSSSSVRWPAADIEFDFLVAGRGGVGTSTTP